MILKTSLQQLAAIMAFVDAIAGMIFLTTPKLDSLLLRRFQTQLLDSLRSDTSIPLDQDHQHQISFRKLPIPF